MHKLTVAMFLMFGLSATSRADFDSANSAYERKDFATALSEFARLAKQGDAQAQYDLALMLANGEGGKRDLTAALGWSLAAQDNGLPQAAGIVDQVRGLTSAAHAQQAQQYVARYGQQSLVPTHLNLFSTTVDAPLKILRSDSLSYPDKGVIGWVEIFYIVDSDGRIRNSWIKEAMPLGTFEADTSAWLSQMKLTPPTVNGKPVAVLGFATVQFTSPGIDGRKLPKLVEWLKQLREKAESGQSDAQTTLAIFERIYPELSRTLGASDQELSSPNGNANHWLAKAAAAGNSAAQFEIGCMNLGSAEALKNLMDAAKHGSPGAAVLLAVISNAEGDVDGEIRALRWLQPAAKAGYGPAMKLLANLLASSEYDEVRDPTAAEVLLKQLRDNKDFASDPNIWQMSAAAAAGRGDFKAALQFQDKAVVAGKRLRWDPEPLQARRNAYAMSSRDKEMVLSRPTAMAGARFGDLTKQRDPATGQPVIPANY